MRREEIVGLASALAAGYRLVPPRAASGRGAGAFAGNRDGQSVDFHDYRRYQPGDDLRRVDWRAYARSGQMHLKLFREEVSPVVEIHLDVSASMGAYPGKVMAAVFIAAFLREATLASEGRPVLCRDGGRHGGGEFLPALLRADFSGPVPLRTAPPAPGAGRPVRVILSDFLFGGDLPALFARHAAGSLAFAPVMLLAESEARPPWRGFCRLRDVEDGGAFLDMALTETSVADYRRRLSRHRDVLDGLARSHGGRLLSLELADDGVDAAALRGIVDRLAEERLVGPC